MTLAMLNQTLNPPQMFSNADYTTKEKWVTLIGYTKLEIK